MAADAARTPKTLQAYKELRLPAPQQQAAQTDPAHHAGVYQATQTKTTGKDKLHLLWR